MAPSSQDHNSMPMHISIPHGSKFHTHAQLPLMGSQHGQTGHTGINILGAGVGPIHKIPKVKVMTPKIIVPKCYAHMNLYLMGSPQAHIGYVGINTMDKAESTRITRSREYHQSQRSQEQKLCTSTHHG